MPVFFPAKIPILLPKSVRNFKELVTVLQKSNMALEVTVTLFAT